MKKVLFTATIDGHIHAFHIPFIDMFRRNGYEVHVASKGPSDTISHLEPYVDFKHEVPFDRRPFSLNNLKSYAELATILTHNHYDMVICNTPVAGALTRIAARKARRNGTSVLYIAHGFHFGRGVPLRHWLLYYPVEWVLSSLTDCLITVNREDLELATRNRFLAKETVRIHGVGVNADLFRPMNIESRKLRRVGLGYQDEDFLLFYAAEFNENKNQKLLIEALASIRHEIPQVKLILAGSGPLLTSCRQLARELGVEEIISFLGFRSDIAKLLPLCDVVVASSQREGLPINILEAMSCQIPVIATDVRGHRELISQGCGLIVPRGDFKAMGTAMKRLFCDRELRASLGKRGREVVMDNYRLEVVLSEFQSIAKQYTRSPLDE